MIKRTVDFFIALFVIVLVAPVLLTCAFLIFIHDKSSPIYMAPRMLNLRETFYMFKLRTMVVDADKKGPTSTKNDDRRITTIGRIIRKFKIDELPQLINVLVGHMSLVGPRPQALEDAKKYTSEEKRLLTIKPGITDFASIVFSDEGSILSGSDDPVKMYDEKIRPMKSRLGLFYIEQRTLFVDISLMIITVINCINRRMALNLLQKVLKCYNCDQEVINFASRN